jgi:hypothetical protein
MDAKAQKAFLLSLLILTISLSGRCLGQTYYYNGFGYTVSGLNIAITGYSGPGGAVEIPATIRWTTGITGTVTSIGNNAFYDSGVLTSVVIPDTVTSIGNDAFGGCINLASVNIPSSVTNIGIFAFAQTSLSSVTIPSTVTSIGIGMFYNCSNLTSVTIPGSATSIGEVAFSNCTGLTNVTIGTGVTSIGDGAFQYCNGLTSVAIPSSVTNIVDWAFANCSGLTSAYFQGDAPSLFGVNTFDYTAPSFSIYYPSTASGWGTPSWWGYPAQPYAYQPAGQRALLALTFGSGAVTPSFNQLNPGANYQLQVSTDLSTWSNTGPAFTATNASEAYAQTFYVTNGNQLFVRLLSAP